jgi:hypothetical protein
MMICSSQSKEMMMARTRKTFVWLAAVALVIVQGLAASARAEWEPPEDGQFTEKQLNALMGALVDYSKMSKEKGQNPSGMEAVMALSGLGDGGEFGDVLKKHGLQTEEFAWLTGQVFVAYTALQMRDFQEGADSGNTEALKDAERNIAQAKEEVETARKQLAEASDSKAKAKAQAALEVAEANVAAQQALLEWQKAQQRHTKALLKQQELESDVPPQNLALLKQHMAEFNKLMGQEERVAGEEPGEESDEHQE